jgi:hypothetical protein
VATDVDSYVTDLAVFLFLADLLILRKGGGDWAADRIVPNAMRALAAGERIPLRNPAATRLGSKCWKPPCGTGQAPGAMAPIPTPPRGRPPAPADRQGPPPCPAGVLPGGSGGLAKAAPGW